MQSTEIRLAEMFKRVSEGFLKDSCLRLASVRYSEPQRRILLKTLFYPRSDQVPLYKNFKNKDQTHRLGSTATEPGIER